jgi:hypothetical protein
MSYESSAAPIATDVRGLLGNAVYAPTAWNFTIHSPFAGGSFTGHSIEFCEGKCLFGTLAATTLRVGTTAGIFQMAFQPNFGSTILNASHLKTEVDGRQWAILMTSGQATRTGSVPLPSMWLSLLAIPLLRAIGKVSPSSPV